MAPFLRARGTDGWFARHVQSHTLIRGLPKDWRRRPGRPHRTWLRTMEADLQPLNHGLNSAWRLAQDRERWKQLVETATLQSGACPRWRWWCMTLPCGHFPSTLTYSFRRLYLQLLLCFSRKGPWQYKICNAATYYSVVTVRDYSPENM